MNNSFFNISKNIANDFLQSIVFIDDNAYIEKAGNPHDFDALEITKYFSLSEKFCSIFRPTKKEDLDSIIKVAIKADVVIVDWEMNFIQEVVSDDIDDEASIDDTDVRGANTKNILKELLSDPKSGKNSLKLIIIYTGTIDLPGITNEIKQHLEEGNFIKLNSQREDKNCCLLTENIRIQVVYKGDPESPKFTHNTELKEQEVTIANLPDFVLTEFTKLTNGLLSNFALKALTEIRRNSHRILSLFSKDIDSAYLAHQIILPNIDDANELLVELFKDIFKDLLRGSQLHQFINKTLIEHWLNENIKTESLALLNKKGSETNKKFTRDSELLRKLLFSENSDVNKRYKEVFKSIDSYNELDSSEKKEDHLNSIIKNSLMLFKHNEILDLNEVNKKFAILTHHKNFIYPLIAPPILLLGTVVESTTGVYYVCIQQRCDSIRVKKERRFLFITLKRVNGNEPFEFITPSSVKLKINKKTYDIRTILFDETKEKIIKAKDIEGEYFFFPKYYNSEGDEKLKWIFELKDLHAQRIVANYCAELSRVGLDESEWLRLNQK